MDDMEIKTWDELRHLEWGNLLLGNGFSIGASFKFHYDSLLDNVDKYRLSMYPHARELFDAIDTKNFEEILRVIYHAYLVNFYNLDAIRTLYHNVRKTLIESVNVSHVEHRDVPVEKVNDALCQFNKVFTTNYDLIPYWSFMNGREVSFCDFFWNQEGVFDLLDTKIRENWKPIFYLHGAIHLKQAQNGLTYKVRATREMSIADIIDENEFNEIPLFISEGKSEIKLRRIRENDYLNFCFNQLLNITGNTVVFGHGLDKEYDEHILKALKKSKTRNIAISVYSGMKPKEKVAFSANILSYFADSDKNIVFFDSNTHPLGQVKHT